MSKAEQLSDSSEFMKFSNRLNIPLKEIEDYIGQLKGDNVKTGEVNNVLSAFDIGLKNSKFVPNEKKTKRRLQNAIWRAWWQERRTMEPQVEGEDVLETKSCLQNKLEIHGSQIGDIPTQYSVPLLKPYELPAVGTYVDKNIIPGFKYRVRLNGTNEYLFEGEALCLQSIGQGYGKRLTFESDDLLENPNFFWSDSNHEDGFGFSIQVIREGMRLEILDCQGRRVAEAAVTATDKAQQVEHSRVENGVIELQVKVNFKAKVLFSGDELVPECLKNVEFPVTGYVHSRKKPQSSRAENIEIRPNMLIPGVGKTTMKFI